MKILVAASGLALALIATIGAPAFAQSSCSAWSATCQARCKQSGNAGCQSYCASQMSKCLKSGCWTEGSAHGGATHCSLKTSSGQNGDRGRSG
mgnify:CR=1 FL=1